MKNLHPFRSYPEKNLRGVKIPYENNGKIIKSTNDLVIPKRKAFIYKGINWDVDDLYWVPPPPKKKKRKTPNI